MRDEIKQFTDTCLSTVPSRSIAILAQRSGVNVQTIRHMLNRGKLVNLTTVIALANAANLRIQLVTTAKDVA
jgi:DNA-binding phage protein